MKFSTRLSIILVTVFFTLPLSAQVEPSLDIKDYPSFKVWLNRVNLARLENPDSAIQLFRNTYIHYLEKKDTLNMVKTLVALAIDNGHQVEYQSAYDNLWKALFLADQAQNDEAKIPVYIQLGRYYSFYKRKETALMYFQKAITLSKELVKKGKIGEETISSCYYALCSTYRELNNPAMGRMALDSCYHYRGMESNSAIQSHYLKFEGAFIESRNGRHQAALDSMLSIQPWFEQNSPGFQVLLFAYIGDMYLLKKDTNQAETYYQKALSTADQYKSHLDFTPTIYQRLSNLYLKKQDHKKAFESLKKEKELDAVFFDSRSANNKSLLEIKDEFRLEKEKQSQLTQEQRISQLEQEEKVNFLENLMLLLTIVFLVFAGMLYFNYIRKKHKVEKALNKRKRELELKQANELRELELKQVHELRELEVKKANELLELKNRELATSTLKLIEKDEILSTLKNRLSKGTGDLKADDLKKIVRTISHSNAQNWEEFEARFMSVNKNFYEKLNKKYPKLSRGDQKLCALIKLNLSSKEMAKLLGISNESTHTNRYRLRKKLGLERGVSLTEFIAKL